MRNIVALLLLLVAGAALALGGSSRLSSSPPAKAPTRGGTATAIFAGGCFWCTESDFDKVPGVLSTTSGYIGGRRVNPTYEQVSAGSTGHIEAVRVVYDPQRVSYATLTQRFFRTIDPTDAGGSFCDRGYQYRSAIFVGNAGERRIADAAKAEATRQLRRPVSTLILGATPFYPAEAYHQDYYRKNPTRYRYYRWNCGREKKLRQVWGGVR